MLYEQTMLNKINYSTPFSFFIQRTPSEFRCKVLSEIMPCFPLKTFGPGTYRILVSKQTWSESPNFDHFRVRNFSASASCTNKSHYWFPLMERQALEPSLTRILFRQNVTMSPAAFTFFWHFRVPDDLFTDHTLDTTQVLSLDAV